MKKIIKFTILLNLMFTIVFAGMLPKWYSNYKKGNKYYKKSYYRQAIESYKKAIKSSQKPSDSKKVKGTIYETYYPYYYLGICYYKIDDYENAKKNFRLSLNYGAIDRRYKRNAQHYLLEIDTINKKIIFEEKINNTINKINELSKYNIEKALIYIDNLDNDLKFNNKIQDIKQELNKRSVRAKVDLLISKRIETKNFTPLNSELESLGISKYDERISNSIYNFNFEKNKWKNKQLNQLEFEISNGNIEKAENILNLFENFNISNERVDKQRIKFKKLKTSFINLQHKLNKISHSNINEILKLKNDVKKLQNKYPNLSICENWLLKLNKIENKIVNQKPINKKVQKMLNFQIAKQYKKANKLAFNILKEEKNNNEAQNILNKNKAQFISFSLKAKNYEKNNQYEKAIENYEKSLVFFEEKETSNRILELNNLINSLKKGNEIFNKLIRIISKKNYKKLCDYLRINYKKMNLHQINQVLKEITKLISSKNFKVVSQKNNIVSINMGFMHGLKTNDFLTVKEYHPILKKDVIRGNLKVLKTNEFSSECEIVNGNLSSFVNLKVETKISKINLEKRLENVFK